MSFGRLELVVVRGLAERPARQRRGAARSRAEHAGERRRDEPRRATTARQPRACPHCGPSPAPIANRYGRIDGDAAEAWPDGRDAAAESTVATHSSPGFRYSRWDGTQVGFDLDADALLDEMADDLLYHGDLNAALRRMHPAGLPGPQRRAAHGHARDARASSASGGARSSSAATSAASTTTSPSSSTRSSTRSARASTAASTRRPRSGDQRRQEITRGSRRAAPSELELLPPDLAGRVQALQQYDFMDDAARQRFEELMDELRSSSCRATSTRCPRACRTCRPSRWRG